MSLVNFGNSQKYLERALKVIPNGTQTFSKSRTQYPVGMAPLYIRDGYGSEVHDIDGNPFIDFVCGLGSIVLGNCDQDVSVAVIRQIYDGSIFSLPHPIEIEVSEMLCELIPCAEMVRFGKNGSDATSGAVRLARYYTGRDYILVCEGHYHGWQDWSCGVTGRNGGIPWDVRKLTHTFKYNDIESVHKAFEMWPEIACLIMEPMTNEYPRDGFLEEVKEICHKNGALFIFDEMLTGLRSPKGSFQKFSGVIPDLACFGKAIANGYPLSAIVGKADIMRKMEEIHYSFTFGGDCIALAACKATLKKFDLWKYQDVIDKLHKKLGDHLIGFRGRPTLDFPPEDRKKILQYCYQNGILALDTLNIMMSHTDEDLDKLASVINKAIQEIDNIELRGERIESQFRIRT